VTNTYTSSPQPLHHHVVYAKCRPEVSSILFQPRIPKLIICRRNHKERAQPEQRQKWGLLEKHKDYSLRAKDHKQKRQRIKALKEKAAFRNPDEFHFGMMSSRAENGVKIGDRGNKVLDHDVVELLKQQDSGYLRTMLQQTRRERERLEQGIQVEGKSVVSVKGGVVEGRKIKFVGSKKEQEAFLAEAEDEWEDEDDDEQTDNDEEDEPQPTARKVHNAKDEAQIQQQRLKKKRLHAQEVRRNLLDALKEREDVLVQAEQELELQRAKMSNSIGGVNKNGVKFKIRERKR
jgi:U3 small nucleolar RNA-associated protein 11